MGGGLCLLMVQCACEGQMTFRSWLWPCSCFCPCYSLQASWLTNLLSLPTSHNTNTGITDSCHPTWRSSFETWVAEIKLASSGFFS